jgi:hypothetical protein
MRSKPAFKNISNAEQISYQNLRNLILELELAIGLSPELGNRNKKRISKLLLAIITNL